MAGYANALCEIIRPSVALVSVDDEKAGLIEN
jgi:hypothetical protein